MKKKIFSILFALMLVVSLSLVTAVPVAAADITVGSSGEDHTTIQAAIDAALAGDTIIVSDGIYTEDLTVNIANLTIKSVNGSGSTTIQLVDGVGIDIQGGASGFTLGGASGQGFTVTADSATTFNIQLANAPSGVEISHNTIDSTGNVGRICLNIGAAGASGLTVSTNTFTAGTGDGSIWGPNVVDVTVSNNILNGGAYAVQFSGVTGTSTIIGNTISGYTGSGGIVISNGAGTSGLTISGNNISSCSNGIYFVEYCAQGTAADMTTVTISGNTISGSTNDAIKIGNGTHVLASNFVIVNNKISGSSNYGLENAHSSQQVFAEKNWWGDATGPDHSSNPHGTGQGGDAVTDNVDFTPWYATATTTPSTENVSVEHNPIIAVSDTIQGGIDAALAGDTIIVSNGTYTESLVVNTADITLESVSGRDSTTIQNVGNAGGEQTGFLLMAGATNFTLGGSEGHGFTIEGGTGTAPRLFQLNNAPSGVEVSYNAFDTSDTAGTISTGINIGAAGATGLTVTNNVFVADEDATYQDWPLIGPNSANPILDLIVTNNEFTGSGTPNKYGAAIALENVGKSSLVKSMISGNTISGFDRGIIIGGSSSDLLISNNDVSGCSIGIRFVGSVVMNTVDVEYNDIAGNTQFGLKNECTSGTVNALYNWWGDETGPDHATRNTNAQGNAVSDDVLFSPWLYEPQENFVSDAPSYAGSVVLGHEATLVDTTSYAGGWNSFSTPVTLDSSANTWGELLDLVDGSDLSIVRAQRFDPSTQLWVPVVMNNSLVGSDYSIKPGEGFFIQVSIEGSLPILCSTIPTSPPMTYLLAGWNLAGLSNLTGMSVANALYGISYSVALSASPPNAAAWSVPPGTAGTTMMYLGEAYWVAMGESGILFGFTTTPVADDMTWDLNQ